MAKRRTKAPVKKVLRTEVEEQIISEALTHDVIIKEGDNVVFMEAIDIQHVPTEKGAAMLINGLIEYIKTIEHLSQYRRNNIRKELMRIKRSYLRCL